MRLRLVPNLLTTGNLSAGMLAIYFSGKGKIVTAAVLVIAAIVFDGLDGWAARKLKQETSFGCRFDSTADFISFGLAPSFIYYHLMRGINVIFLLVLSIFVGASACRLIRFCSLGENNLLKNFRGLPTTASAGLLILLIPLFSKSSGQLVFSISAFFILSVLMLSGIPFWKFNR